MQRRSVLLILVHNGKQKGNHLHRHHHHHRRHHHHRHRNRQHHQNYQHHHIINRYEQCRGHHHHRQLARSSGRTAGVALNTLHRGHLTTGNATLPRMQTKRVRAATQVLAGAVTSAMPSGGIVHRRAPTVLILATVSRTRPRRHHGQQRHQRFKSQPSQRMFQHHQEQP